MGSSTTTAMTSTRANNNNDEDSTSDYTDPENSAPTELLAEFLTSIMRKDYVNALKYCQMSNINDNFSAELILCDCFSLNFQYSFRI